MIVLDAIVIALIIGGFGYYRYARKVELLTKFEIHFIREHDARPKELVKLGFSDEDKKFFIHLCEYHIKLKKLLKYPVRVENNYLGFKQVPNYPFPVQMVRCTERFAIMDAGVLDYHCAYMLKKTKPDEDIPDGTIFRIYAKFCYWKESGEKGDKKKRRRDRYPAEAEPVTYHTESAPVAHRFEDRSTDFAVREIPIQSNERLQHRYEDHRYASNPDRGGSDDTSSLSEDYSVRYAPATGRRPAAEEVDMFAEYQSSDELEDELLDAHHNANGHPSQSVNVVI